MNYKDIFLLYLYVFIILGIYIFSVLMAYIGEINEKWDDYKCNPVIMPIAGYIKQGIPDPVEFTDKNFKDCAAVLMKPVAEAGINAPVKPVLGVFENTLGSLNDSVFSVFGVLVYRFRMMMMSVLQSLSNTFNVVSSSIQGTGFRVQYIMKRLGGIMTTIVYKLASIVKLQEASYNYSLRLTKIILGIGLAVGLFNTPIMIFTTAMIALLKLDGIKFCFHPDSHVTLWGGEKIKAKHITPGNKLEGGEYITSTFKLRSQGKKFVKLGGMIVTEDHKVIHDGRIIEAREHPDVSECHSRYNNPPYIVCWNTSIGSFKQGGIIFQDYEGEKIVNNAEGLHENTPLPVWYDDFYSYKQARNIKIGDKIGLNRAMVLGLVKTRVPRAKCVYLRKTGNIRERDIMVGEHSKIEIGKIYNTNRDGDYTISKNENINIQEGGARDIYLYTFITNKGRYEISPGIFFYDYENTPVQLTRPKSKLNT
jgi:hypothetical protein